MSYSLVRVLLFVSILAFSSLTASDANLAIAKNAPPIITDDDDDDDSEEKKTVVLETTGELQSPTRLMADGEPINIGELSSIAHAGPWIADVDCDGDEDLLVGDFPGYFWMFENQGSNEKPEYTSKGKLEAGGEAAKTPVY